MHKFGLLLIACILLCPLFETLNAQWTQTKEPYDRRLQVLVIVQNFTRECVGLGAAAKLEGMNVVSALGRITEVHGVPKCIKVDNGPELISKDLNWWRTGTTSNPNSSNRAAIGQGIVRSI